MSRLTKLRAFKWPTVAYEVQKNLLSRARGRNGGLRAVTAVGATLGDPAERIGYSRSVFEGCLAHGGLDRADVAGMRVLELGPGEDLCVALRFLAAGAGKVSCIDRFRFEIPAEWERDVYRLLLADLDDEGRGRLSGLVGADGELAADESRLKVVRGAGIEEGAQQFRDASFDLIVSVAVLEHVYDLGASMRAMDAVLAPGGVMMHQVDLRDHGMFSNGGRHPLEFLTLRPGIYELMTSHTGAPNRERIGTYRALLDQLGHEAVVKVSNVGGARTDLEPYAERIVLERDVDAAMVASIERLRPRLAPRFATLPTEELAATGILIRSQKPASA